MRPLAGSGMDRLRKYFVGGLLVIIPVVITIWIVERLFGFFSGFLRGPVTLLLGGPDVLRQPLPLLEWAGARVEHLVPVASVFLLVFLIVATGFVTRNYLGSRLLSLGEAILGRIPIIRRIYTAVRQIIYALLSDRQQAFRRAVMFEYPRKGVWSIGFVTAERADMIGEPEEGAPGDRHYHVFLPTTPNPTSGYFLIVPKKDCVELDMPVQEALKLVISGGAVMPEGGGKGEGLPAPSVTDAGDPTAHPPQANQTNSGRD